MRKTPGTNGESVTGDTGHQRAQPCHGTGMAQTTVREERTLENHTSSVVDVDERSVGGSGPEDISTGGVVLKSQL